MSRWQTLVPVLAIALCAILIHPRAEIGILDDWAYIKMVQVLGRSGHIVYNGDESAIVGWQLPLGLAFTRLFGFSFTVVRMSTVVAAMGVAFLLQRTFLRIGVSAWNSTVATLGFVLSPLFLPLAFTFMTDIPGVFTVVCSVYASIRALQATSERIACAWLTTSCVASLIGGTGRQVMWLGCLVLLPSAVWLLRRSRFVVFYGTALWVFCAAVIAACMHWYAQQSYSLTAEILPSGLTKADLLLLAYAVIVILSPIALSLLPFLVPFVRYVWVRSWRSAAVVSAGAVVFSLFAASLIRHHDWNRWVALGDLGILTRYGVLDGLPIPGLRPVLIPNALRFLITAGMVAGLLGLLGYLAAPRGPRLQQPQDASSSLSDRQLAILLVPFTAAYFGLMLLRFRYPVFERYQLVIIPLLLLGLVRLYQFRISPRLPAITVVLVALFATYTVAATHDAFAMFRARVDAIHELRTAGVPPYRIDAGFEYDGWTQIEQAGFVNDPRIRLPPGVQAPVYQPGALSCSRFFYPLVPAVHPEYALSFDPQSCGGPAGFPPAVYHPWLGASPIRIYIVRVTPAGHTASLDLPPFQSASNRK